MRILHIDTGPEMRGGQRQLLLLARGLAKRGHEQVVACRMGGKLEAEAAHLGLETVGIGPSRLGCVLKLRRLLRRRGIEIIHAHDGRGQTLGLIASAGTPARRVASRRVSFRPRGGVIHRLKYSRTCDLVIAVSEFVRDELVRSGVPSAKIAVVPDGIEFPETLPDKAGRELARGGFGLGSAEFVMGHAGAFTLEKGQEIAIDAFTRVKARLPAARLLLAGDGPLRAALQRKWSQDAALLFPGHLDDLAPFMNCLDVFLMPSLNEGLGSTALIAMAHRVPVIASRTGGLREIVRDGETGWTFTPGSADDLAEKILAAAADQPARALRGGTGRERARAFTDDIMVRKTEELYQRLADPSLGS